MTEQPSPTTPAYQRLRIYFRKEGDLRWIGHRDLVRVVERLCRRAGLGLRMSEGFHPKPKLRFPSALALGIEGQGEVLELDLVDHVEPTSLPDLLNGHAPHGLVFTHAEALSASQRKARVSLMHYQFPIPSSRQIQVAEAMADLLAATTFPVEREGRSEPIDLLASLTSLQMHDDAVRFTLRATDRASAQPRDVLQALGLAELEQRGCFLTRSQVEVTS